MLGYEAAEYMDAPSRGYESAASRAGSQSASSWPGPPAAAPPPTVGSDEEDVEEATRLLALKLSPALEVGGCGLTAMAGLTAAELLPAAEWWSLPLVAPGVLDPPLPPPPGVGLVRPLPPPPPAPPPPLPGSCITDVVGSGLFEFSPVLGDKDDDGGGTLEPS